MSLKGKVAVVTGSTSGIGLGIARALGAAGADLMLNGFGDAAAIEQERAGLAAEFGIRVAYNPADMSKPEQIAGDDRRGGEDARRRGHPGQQRRHPARRQYRGFSRRSLGCDHRDQSLGGVPRHAGRDPGDEAARLGPDHQHRLGARAGRQRAEGRLRRGQARRGRHDQGGGDRAGQLRHHRQRDLPRLGADAAGAAAVGSARRGGGHQRRTGARTRSWRRSSRCCGSPRRRRSAALAVFLCSDAAETITGVPLSIDGGWVAQ